MERIKRWLEEKLFWLKTGARIEMVNNGESVEPIVIRFENYFIEVLLDAETGEPCNFGWSDDPGMFHVPTRDHYTASKDKFCNTGCKTAKCLGKEKPLKETGKRAGHRYAPPGKRVRVTQTDGEQFVAKFKEKTGNFHHFHDHEKVKSSKIRQLSILTTDYPKGSDVPPTK